MDWNAVDEGFIGHGELLLSLDYREHTMPKNMEAIAKEIAAKAYIYNMLIK